MWMSLVLFSAFGGGIGVSHIASICKLDCMWCGGGVARLCNGELVRCLHTTSQPHHVYDSEVELFSTFIWTDTNGVEQLRMMLADHGSEHMGEVHFVRGGDLFNGFWEDQGNKLALSTMPLLQATSNLLLLLCSSAVLDGICNGRAADSLFCREQHIGIHN